MVSEGSCDTEDWSNGFWKFSIVITGVNYVVKLDSNRRQLF